ncbi:hypothetical protein FLONG3_387 [Fusarium longipes]|uniref:Uncharacterized protein n=1 Tax=Fusarium longipes TaxID=694270 RepID=A0A395TA06_9HYPO|nr:hypothetical protein FLONG3_387 [Fusarium longipes]
MGPKGSRKLKPAVSQTSSRSQCRAATIPSTPISHPMSSSQTAKKRRVEYRQERIAETPRANKRRATSSRGQQTPKRTIQLVQATSPNTPFEVSSAESSESDCKIEKVLPSPKRKLVAASPRARPAKKAKMERSVAPSSGDESDCVIEKVLPSPKRRQVQQQRAKKRRRVGDSIDTPVSIESDIDSDVENVISQPESTQTQTPDQSRAHSPDIMDALFAWLDGPQSGGAASGDAHQETASTSEDSLPKVPSSTASERPVQAPLTSRDQDRKAQDEKSINPASGLENKVPSLVYELQPIYSGDKLQETHTPGTPSQFRPHHRESLVGLKSILKRSSEQKARIFNHETEFPPFSCISPVSGDEHVISSPTERIQNDKHQAKIIPAEDEPIFTPSPPVSFTEKLKLANLRSKDWKPSQPKKTCRPSTPLTKPLTWLRQKIGLEPLTFITDDATEAAPDQETPSKPPTERASRTAQTLVKIEPHQSSDNEESEDEHPNRIEKLSTPMTVKQETSPNLPTQPATRRTQKLAKAEEKCVTGAGAGKAKHHKLGTTQQFTPSKPLAPKIQMPIKIDEQHFSDAEESEGEVQKRLEEEQLVPDPHQHWAKPPLPGKEIKPQFIRDSVSEHAIKPTVAAFEKKSAAGHGFTFKNNESNHRYNWNVDWSVRPSLNERESRAVASELEHRGIKTERQYNNFWYNITMKLSSIAGSPVPLFTAKKKALETFVEEALLNDENRRRMTRKNSGNKTKRLSGEGKKKKHSKKHSRDVDKLLTPGDTVEKKRRKNTKKLPQGVNAFLIPGDTDEDTPSSSDSDSDGEDLMAKIQADIDRQRRRSGGGTSCGYRKGDH